MKYYAGPGDLVDSISPRLGSSKVAIHTITMVTARTELSQALQTGSAHYIFMMLCIAW